MTRVGERATVSHAELLDMLCRLGSRRVLDVTPGPPVRVTIAEQSHDGRHTYETWERGDLGWTCTSAVCLRPEL